MENKKRFLAKFLGYSAAFFLLWLFLADSYVHIPMALAQVSLKLLGASDIRLAVDRHTVFLSGKYGGGGLSVLDVTLNSIFFLALCLAVLDPGAPKKPWKRVSLGLAVLLSFQTAVLTLFSYGFCHQMGAASMAAKFLAGLAKFFLPILLWMLLFYLPPKLGIVHREDLGS